MTLEQGYTNSVEVLYIPVVTVYTELKIMNYQVMDVNVVPVFLLVVHYTYNVYKSSLAANDQSLCTENPLLYSLTVVCVVVRKVRVLSKVAVIISFRLVY